MSKTPLSLVMESARKALIESLNKVLSETNLPAYLVEGIMCEMLAEVRKQKNIELIADISAMSQTEEKEGE